MSTSGPSATRRRVWVFVAAGGTASLALLPLVAIDRRDPSWSATGMWIASMVGLVVTMTLHDRGAGVLRRLAAAARWRRADSVGLVSLTAVAWLIRSHRLGLRLPLLHGDEGEMAVLARRAMQGAGSSDGPLPVFTTGFLDHPTLFHHVQAVALRLGGDSFTSLRSLSAVSGALGVGAVYVLARLAWGRSAALVAGWLACMSAIHIQYSRIALNNIESATLVTLTMALLVAAVVLHRPVESRVTAQPSSLALFGWLGLVVGVSQYLYFGSRLLPVVVAFALAVLYRRGLARGRDVAAATGGLVVAVLPLARHYLRNPATFGSRSDGVSVFGRRGLAHEMGPDATLPADLWPLLTRQVRGNLSFFGAPRTVRPSSPRARRSTGSPSGCSGSGQRSCSGGRSWTAGSVASPLGSW